MMQRSKWKWLLLIAALLTGMAGLYAYHLVYASNTLFTSANSMLIYVHTSADVEQWIHGDGQFVVKNEQTFLRAAKLKNMQSIKPGRYRIKQGMCNNEMINMLRIGAQEPVRIRIDDATTMYQLAARLGKYLKSDSMAFIRVFADELVCEQYGFNANTIGSLVMPDTYDFFWTTTPQEFLEKMLDLHNNYWTEENKNKATRVGLSVAEVHTMASIVKAECVKKDEAPAIAGLYLNRLRIGMPLQADPTSVFAAGLRNVSRVSEKMTSVVSPYNTYKNKGLPPGPINFPETVYIDAVLNADVHTYIYMCAQPGATGYHNFTADYSQHLKNRRAYTSWLNQKNIR
ncbi:MAG: endolytic transglycosylase MltG [Flavobacteriales bacterium]